jgi:hypothetical protein
MMPTIESRPTGTLCLVDRSASWRGYYVGVIVRWHASVCLRSMPLLILSSWTTWVYWKLLIATGNKHPCCQSDECGDTQSPS